MVKTAKAWIELVCIAALWCIFDWRAALAGFLLMWFINISVAASRER